MSDSVTKQPIEPVSSNFTISDPVLSSPHARNLQSYLAAYIQSALLQSRSGTLPVESSLQLLDKAWRMQKLLWQLQRFSHQ